MIKNIQLLDCPEALREAVEKEIAIGPRFTGDKVDVISVSKHWIEGEACDKADYEAITVSGSQIFTYKYFGGLDDLRENTFSIFTMGEIIKHAPDWMKHSFSEALKSDTSDPSMEEMDRIHMEYNECKRIIHCDLDRELTPDPDILSMAVDDCRQIVKHMEGRISRKDTSREYQNILETMQSDLKWLEGQADSQTQVDSSANSPEASDQDLQDCPDAEEPTDAPEMVL